MIISGIFIAGNIAGERKTASFDDEIIFIARSRGEAGVIFKFPCDIADDPALFFDVEKFFPRPAGF